jgi:outer membrane lipoprotein-sorting protein
MALLLLACSAMCAQSFKERVAALQQSYVGMDRVHIKMSIQVFTDVASAKPYHREEVDIKRDKYKYSYQYGTTHMLMNDDYMVMVNKTSREILWSKRSPEQQQKVLSDPFKMNLDSILTFYGTPVLVEKKGSVEHYSLEQKNGQVRQVDLFIDSADNVLKRLEYRYVEKYYVVIEFNVFDKAPVFDAETFRESRYVWLDQGKFKAAESYRGYRVIAGDGFQNK